MITLKSVCKNSGEKLRLEYPREVLPRAVKVRTFEAGPSLEVEPLLMLDG